jgi:hypothetical protein
MSRPSARFLSSELIPVRRIFNLTLEDTMLCFLSIGPPKKVFMGYLIDFDRIYALIAPRDQNLIIPILPSFLYPSIIGG